MNVRAHLTVGDACWAFDGWSRERLSDLWQRHVVVVLDRVTRRPQAIPRVVDDVTDAELQLLAWTPLDVEMPLIVALAWAAYLRRRELAEDGVTLAHLFELCTRPETRHAGMLAVGGIPGRDARLSCVI